MVVLQSIAVTAGGEPRFALKGLGRIDMAAQQVRGSLSQWKSPVGDVGHDAVSKLIDLLFGEFRVLADLVHGRKPTPC